MKSLLPAYDFGIDVLLPVAQTSPYLIQAIESIVDQDFANWILYVLIDKGDPNIEVVRAHIPRAKLKIIEFEDTFNLSNRLNYGISLGTSQYIARMDADDVSVKNRFSSQVHMLHVENYHLVGSSAKVIDSNGMCIGKIRVNALPYEIKSNLLRKNQFIHPSLMFRRAVTENIKFNAHLIRAQDYGFILEVAKSFDISNNSEFLLCYRIHNLNHSNHKLSLNEMKILGKLKFEIARVLGKNSIYSVTWHAIWVFKNIFLSPARSLNLRISLNKLKVYGSGHASNKSAE